MPSFDKFFLHTMFLKSKKCVYEKWKYKVFEQLKNIW